VEVDDRVALEAFADRCTPSRELTAPDLLVLRSAVTDVRLLLVLLAAVVA
jgi:hypothetical protein